MSLIQIVIGKYYNIEDSYNYFITMNKSHPETRQYISEKIKEKIKVAYRLKDAHSPVLTNTQITCDIIDIMKNVKDGKEYVIDSKIEAQSNVYKMNFYHASFDRVMAESILASNEVGSWLLRPSSICPTKFMLVCINTSDTSDTSVTPTMHYFALSIRLKEGFDHYLLRHEFGIGYYIVLGREEVHMSTFPLLMIELVNKSPLIPKNVIL
jgi:hypothetical protein